MDKRRAWNDGYFVFHTTTLLDFCNFRRSTRPFLRDREKNRCRQIREMEKHRADKENDKHVSHGDLRKRGKYQPRELAGKERRELARIKEKGIRGFPGSLLKNVRPSSCRT